MIRASRTGEIEMNASTTHTIRQRILLAIAAALLALACAVAIPPAASAAYSIASFGGETVDDGGAPVTLAGAHPNVTTELQISGDLHQDASLKDATVGFPAGLVMNPSAIPKCSRAGVAGLDAIGNFPGTVADCPPASQVGTVDVLVNGGGFVGGVGALPLYNVEPPVGTPARFSATSPASSSASTAGCGPGPLRDLGDLPQHLADPALHGRGGSDHLGRAELTGPRFPCGPAGTKNSVPAKPARNGRFALFLLLLDD